MSTGDGGTNGSKKPRGPRILPTDRIAFGKQLSLLRAWAAASGPTGKVVTNEEVASIVKMVAPTVSMANAFFADAGLLLRQPGGGFIPAPDVMNFTHSYDWNPENAAQKLTPILEPTWFAQAILTRLSYAPLGADDATQVLAEAANAPPDKRGQLGILLEYLKAASLIVEDNGTYRRGRTASRRLEPEEAQDRDSKPSRAAEPAEPVPAQRGATVATTFAAPTEGVVQFHVSVRVDMREFSGWQADRISAFFGGIAEVLKAKGAIEKNASG